MDLTPEESEAPERTMALSVIIPARNEAETLPLCLRSLVAQSEPGFALGLEWELIVVDDGSTDGTRTRAAGFEGVQVLDAPAVTADSGMTGKNGACWTGAQAAQGELLLFTDADTVHELGDLSRARRELEKYGVSMLSYSPRQLVSGLAQRVVMPLVFAELAKSYPMQQVNDAGQRMAAANGQFLMVRAEDYFAVGGHRAVGTQVLEDVALARNIKRGRRTIRFRYAADALSTRMYRTTVEMMEGWTKNLALLFANPLPMAALALLQFLLVVGIPLVALVYPFLTPVQRILLGVVWLRSVIFFYRRVRRSNFPVLDCLLAVFGLPLFAALLVRSYLQVKVRKQVGWKGRVYRTDVR